MRWRAGGKTKWVKRLNLIYADESRQAFGYRLRQARKRRAEVGQLSLPQALAQDGPQQLRSV